MESVFKVVVSGDDFLFIDSSSLSTIELKFPMKRFKKPVSTLEDCVNTANLYSRVTIHVKVYELNQVESVDLLQFQSAEVADNSGVSRQLTLYGHLIDKVKLGSCYEITEVTVSKFNGSRVLKTSEQSIISEIDNSSVSCDLLEHTKKLIQGTVANVIYSSLDQVLHCPKCKKCVQEEDNLIICIACNNVSAATQAIKCNKLKFTIITVENKRLHLSCSHKKIEELTSVSITNKVALLKQLFNMPVELTYSALTLVVDRITQQNND